MTGDIAVVLGTRPEIIKLAPVIKALGARARVIHTGQHWDDDMAGQFFRDLGIGEPDIKLHGMKGKPRATQIAIGIQELSSHFKADPPAAVIVQGDTNSTSAGAQAASYSNIPVVHVEAGLRSHDRAMPEELNRLVVGVLADLHCAATVQNRRNLVSESIDAETIHVTGNTVVEATLTALEKATSEYSFNSSGQKSRILATIHRPENTDSKESLERILKAFDNSKAEVIFAIHPRTLAAIKEFGLGDLLSNITTITGLSHGPFLKLALEADLLVSDSGGIQEEATVIKKPLLVVRKSTERPESIESGFARLITPDLSLDEAIKATLSDEMLYEKLKSVPSPYGDGNSGQQIAQLVLRLVDKNMDHSI